MTDAEKTTVYLGATRYYLGRSSYAVKDFCEVLKNVWANLPDGCKRLIIREVDEAIARDNLVRAEARRPSWAIFPLGMDIDRDQWMEARKLWIEEDDPQGFAATKTD